MVLCLPESAFIMVIQQPYAKIRYQDKKTLQIKDVTFPCVSNEHAMKIAKKLRPKYHKIVSVSVTYPFNI